MKDILYYYTHRALEIISFGKARIIRYYIFAQPVQTKELLPKSRGKNIEIKFINQWDNDFLQFPRPKEVIENHLKQEASCFVAKKGSRVIGFLWLVKNAYEEDEVRCRFLLQPKDKVMWDFDVYINPEERIGFAFLKLWDAANTYMRNNNSQWSLSRISSFNQKSLASHSKLGAVIIASATFLCVGKLQASFFSTAPFINISLNTKTRPTLIVSPIE